jgi:hypothetical protein
MNAHDNDYDLAAIHSGDSGKHKDVDFFHCDSRERPKRKGKLLKKALKALGYDLSLAACHNAVARMYGFRHLSDLYESVGMFGRSPGDEEVDEADFVRRFWFQVDTLVEIGVSVGDAEAGVDSVRPTGSHASFSGQAQPPRSPRDRAQKPLMKPGTASLRIKENFHTNAWKQ